MQLTAGKNLNLGNVTQNVKRIADATGRMLESNLNNNLQWFTEMQNVFGSFGFGFGKKDDCCGACPPECNCPQNCLININRDAYYGEVIMVPFKVKNTLQTAKQYKVGVRPFYDENGNLLPNQPLLNKTDLNLQPGQSMPVMMRIDIANGYVEGHSYSTEIVIREKEVNQNICFTLNIIANTAIPEAKPLKEQDYFNHFQDWKSHYYCEKKPSINRITVNPVDTIVDIPK